MALSAISALVIPSAATSKVKGLTVVPAPERTKVPSVPLTTSFPITPSFSVTVTEPRSTNVQSVPFHCIT